MDKNKKDTFVAFNGKKYRVYASNTKLSLAHIVFCKGHLFTLEDAKAIAEGLNALYNLEVETSEVGQ
jgi:hypothetical protein